MSDDGIKTTILSAVLAALTGAIGWLVTKVLGNEKDLVKQDARLGAVECDVAELKDGQLTQDCVRDVVDNALERRDRIAEERRREWDRRLALEIRAAVHEEVERATARFRPQSNVGS